MIRFLFALTIVFLSVLPVQARPVPPLDGLEALRKAFADVSDFTAEIVQEKRLSLMKRTMTMNGTVRFRKPDLFFMEILSPYPSRLLLRDNVVEQITGTGDRNRIVLPPEQGLKRWFSKIAEPITVMPEGMKVLADKSGAVYTVTIMPQGKGQVRELVITFQEDGVIKRLVIAEQNGDRAVMTFRKVRKNIRLTEKDFRLE
ncbi:LolA family protein [Pelotalea chapellei]|uniref:Outer membrane lipoprotein carrier protein LolA n=1 Tax=Pelotalea chapellei TaxID=44671 RepID=A0ABS5U733_9BACT|nr:outer membrane lipoprotein carrier protein LolA [Pelotalea chapellei]MBT1071475.1 outer membrane lipoprotein carrier protein LolA [Pelotalea chapellei]